MKKIDFDGGFTIDEPIMTIPANFDYASLYPGVYHLSDEMKQRLRRIKLNNIIDNINNENII